MSNELFTISEFCKVANLGRTVTYQLINQGRVKALKLGRKTLIPKASLDDFISSLPAYPIKK